MVKLLLKLIWLGFGVFGLVTVGQKYFPNFNPAVLFQASQKNMTDIAGLDPNTAGEVLGERVKTEVMKILESSAEQIKTFPAKQVKKIKIGACEELLEEDICSVAKEIECQ